MRRLEKKKSGKKVVVWGKGLVVFITKEARELGWDNRTMLRVSVENDDGKKYIKLEKLGRI